MTVISMTYAELAERLGVSVDGARMKVKRAKWAKLKGNDGCVRVLVPEHDLASSEHVPPPLGEQAGEQVRTLEAHIATLKEQAEQMQEQIGKAEARADAEREKVADLTAQLLKITADGEFGPKTHRAVVEYQKSKKITADGKVGPQTWSKLKP